MLGEVRTKAFFAIFSISDGANYVKHFSRDFAMPLTTLDNKPQHATPFIRESESASTPSDSTSGAFSSTLHSASNSPIGDRIRNQAQVLSTQNIPFSYTEHQRIGKASRATPEMVVTEQAGFVRVPKAYEWQEIAEKIADKLSIVFNQTYSDGNHRTTLFQMCTEALKYGVCIKYDMTKLYGKVDALYTNKSKESEEVRKQHFAHFIRSKLKFEADKGKRMDYLNCVKESIKELPDNLKALSESARRYDMDGSHAARFKARIAAYEAGPKQREEWRKTHKLVKGYHAVHNGTTHNQN